MAEFSCERHGSTDIITIAGVLGDEEAIQLKNAVSTLRQQGSTKIILSGKSIEQISASNLNEIARPIRVFRNMGGKVALAGCSEETLKVMDRLSWFRYLNVFQTEEEAKRFLEPERDD